MDVVLQRLADDGVRANEFQSSLGSRHDLIGFPDNLDGKSEFVRLPGQRLKVCKGLKT